MRPVTGSRVRVCLGYDLYINGTVVAHSTVNSQSSLVNLDTTNIIASDWGWSMSEERCRKIIAGEKYTNVVPHMINVESYYWHAMTNELDIISPPVILRRSLR